MRKKQYIQPASMAVKLEPRNMLMASQNQMLLVFGLLNGRESGSMKNNNDDGEITKEEDIW